MKNKGVSPVVATVLLISMVIIIALIIFFWIRGFTQEAVVKFDKNIELVCSDVEFEASYSDGFLYISNLGNIPIFSMKAKTYVEGSHSTITLSDDWPETGLNQGGVYSAGFSVGDGEKIALIPVLIGSSENGEQTFTCEEGQYGEEIIL